MVDKAHGWTTCPICNARLKSGKLDGHMKNVHPKGVRTREERGKIVGRRKSASKAAKVSAVAILVVVIIIVIYFAWPYLQPRGSNVGDKPYNFNLKSTDDTTYNLDDNLGDRPILIAFMSTTCVHCAVTTDSTIVPLYNNYSSKVEFVIILSDPDAKMSDCRVWAQEHNVDFTVLHDAGGTVFEKYDPGVSYFPMLFLIGNDSKIHYKETGEISYQDLENEIKDVL